MKPPEPTAFIRYDFARKYLHGKRVKIDHKSMRELLSNHSVPICTHNEISTLRSVIAKTNERKMFVADGYSCASELKGIKIPR